MLSLQIAAGIVLGYAIIANRGALLRLLNVTMIGLSWIVGLGVLAFGVVWLWGLVTDNLHQILNVTGYILMMALYVCGAIGFAKVIKAMRGGRSLFDHSIRMPELHKGDRDRGDLFVGMILAVGNALLVTAVTWPLLDYTVVGEWWARMDNMSRQNGYADSFSLLSNAMVCQWPWVVLRLISKRQNVAAEAPE